MSTLGQFLKRIPIRGIRTVRDYRPHARERVSLNYLRQRSKAEIERASIAACQTAYLGDHKTVCRVLTRYLVYVNTVDRSLAPHMMMNGFWEMWITQAILRYVRPGMRVVDIGANLGYYSLLLADCVGPDGHLWAIEPNPELHALMSESIEVNGFKERSTLICKACGATDGERVVLKVPTRYHAYATLGEHAFDNYPDLECTDVECQIARLDAVVEENGKIDFIKIDAEGAEPAIWEGMQQVLHRSPNIAIALEFAVARYEDSVAFLDRIVANGFRLQQIGFDGLIHKVSRETLLASRDWSMLWLQRDQ